MRAQRFLVVQGEVEFLTQKRCDGIFDGICFTLRPSSSGGAVTPTAYRMLCRRFAHLVRRYTSRLRHGRKTRYGWVATPYPTGTFTLQETPSLSWRDNAGPQARWIAEATKERRLFTVACTHHAITGSPHGRN